MRYLDEVATNQAAIANKVDSSVQCDLFERLASFAAPAKRMSCLLHGSVVNTYSMCTTRDGVISAVEAKIRRGVPEKPRMSRILSVCRESAPVERPTLVNRQSEVAGVRTDGTPEVRRVELRS